MNNVQFGRQRDDKIVELVTRGGAFTRKQIELLLFNQKDATRKAQLRLSMLSKQGRLNKFSRSPHEPTIYHVGKLAKRTIDHTILVNDVYQAIMLQKKSYFKVVWAWDYPLMGGIRWADAMLDVYDMMAKRRHVVFVEVERYADHKFQKDKNYEAIAQMAWTNEGWAIKEPTRTLFPAILVVTETPLKIKSDLDFFVAPIKSIQKDIYSIFMRR